jgi:formylglycine-generating enzyme required for sulfatase activity
MVADAFPRGSDRVNRGGCWVNYGSGCQAAVRNGDSPSFQSNSIGVRLARVPVR